MRTGLGAALFSLVLAVYGPAVSGSALAADAATVAFGRANPALREQLSRTDAPPPGMSNPDYAKLVSEAFDLDVIDEEKDQSLEVILDVCSEAVQTDMAYLLLGMNTLKSTGGDQDAAAMIARLQSRNAVRFQDEIAAAQRFDIACMAAEMRKMEVWVKQLKPQDMTPARRAGLAQAQTGMVQIISGTAQSQLDPVRLSNRQTMLAALVDHIDQLAPAMSETSRETAGKAIDRVLASSALSVEAREKLIAVQRSLARATCDALCAADDRRAGDDQR